MFFIFVVSKNYHMLKIDLDAAMARLSTGFPLWTRLPNGQLRTVQAVDDENVTYYTNRRSQPLATTPLTPTTIFYK